MQASNSSVDYSFTLTLKPKLYKDVAEQQYDKTYREVILTLKTLSPHFTCVAELTKGMNIHYHGQIKFFNFKPRTNLGKKFVDTFRASESIGFVSIKQITDSLGWKQYITKELEVTRDSIGRPAVLHDAYGLCLEYENDPFMLNRE